MALENPYSQVRRWRRVQAELRAKVTYTREKTLQIANGRSQDLGESGMAVYVPVELTIGDSVELEFTVPRSHAPLRIRATVRNRMGFRYGMEFVVISKAQREEIARFVEFGGSFGA